MKYTRYAPETFEQDGHIIAKATGLCILDCPQCERNEVNRVFITAIVVALLVAAAFLLAACGCCGMRSPW